MSHSQVCYYCDDNLSSSTKFNKPVCEECNTAEFRCIEVPKHRTEEQEALRLKLLISVFKHAFEDHT